MKRHILLMAICLIAMNSFAAPARVVLLDFEDETGVKPDALLGGTIAAGSLAKKGVYLLSKELLTNPSYVLVDRREYIAQVERLRPTDSGKLSTAQPTSIHAAQQLNADVILRGVLLSFSTGKDVVNQGGFRTEFSTLTVRVALEALDAVDGTVIAMSEGSASEKFRQTQSTQTMLSEDDALKALEAALMQALPDLQSGLAKRQQKAEERETISLSISTSDDPALIEIDGVLIGSSPLKDHRLYKGDHVLTVGKPGYRDVTKRILFEKDTSIEVPMMRTELSADEMKEVLEKARLQMFSGVEPALIINTTE